MGSRHARRKRRDRSRPGRPRYGRDDQPGNGKRKHKASAVGPFAQTVEPAATGAVEAPAEIVRTLAAWVVERAVADAVG